ncbi:hypothetical protein [Evansella cellulosilytica]|uniref:DUF2802 domain-containing protein n=1 Tax=Evansella cellulosilytica (strain ATCC 21833 / DSM 2522 / FERM P-1141 / JCM 9156 / N-4) TaxID=649639 RepID=E6TWW5_EVAC2|nr:hypothetical protein [Evansella cellulosilytica]ADU29915.1 hypothetical protein Bcell_1652 [Evansella cellulosilytica DSM 2522]
MEITIIILFVLSTLLFILSITQKDRSKEVEKQLENLSIQLMQEMYQIKKKVKVLEEETMLPSLESNSANSNRPLTRDDVLTMYEDGYSVEDIAMITNKEEAVVEELLSSRN